MNHYNDRSGQVLLFVSDDDNGLIVPFFSWNNALLHSSNDIVREDITSLEQMAPNSDQSLTLVIANLHLVPNAVGRQWQERSTLSGQDDGEMRFSIYIIIILSHGCFCFYLWPAMVSWFLSSCVTMWWTRTCPKLYLRVYRRLFLLDNWSLSICLWIIEVILPLEYIVVAFTIDSHSVSFISTYQPVRRQCLQENRLFGAFWNKGGLWRTYLTNLVYVGTRCGQQLMWSRANRLEMRGTGDIISVSSTTRIWSARAVWEMLDVTLVLELSLL